MTVRCFSRDDLLSLRPAAQPISRCIRKTLFSFGLWQPGRYRRVYNSARQCDDSPDVAAPKKVRNKNNNNGGRTISAACLNVRSIRNKTAIVADIISESKLQILGLTETWHECCDDVALKKLLCPATVALRLLENRMREAGHTVELRSSTAIRFLPNRSLSNRHQQRLKSQLQSFHSSERTFSLL